MIEDREHGVSPYAPPRYDEGGGGGSSSEHLVFRITYQDNVTDDVEASWYKRSQGDIVFFDEDEAEY